MNEQEARRLAEDALDLDTWVITDVEEHEPGWVFFYDSIQHHLTGELRDAVAGNAPLLVDRTDGSVHRTGTARPISEYMRRYAERDPGDDRSWHP